MKRSRFFKILTTLTLLSLILCPFIISSGAYAKESLSPAIDKLSQNTVFTKNGMKNSAVSFTASEFEDVVGISRLSSITVLVLPDEGDGKLLLGKVPVLANQIIPRSKLSKLTFVPQSERVNDASFVFGCISSGQPRVVSCSIKFTDTLNFAPSASVSTLSAYAGVQLNDFLSADDPDGDKMTFTIISRPQSGTLSLKDPSSGEFVYTADENAPSEDSFSYVATDCYGNASQVTDVTVKIKKSPSVNYVDISADFEHSALLLAEKGIFIGRSVGKYNYFEPKASVSYSEFITMAMSAAGVYLPESDRDIVSAFENISDVEVSADEIMTSAKAVEIASDIYGKALNVFELPSGELTRETAAKIILEMID